MGTGVDLFEPTVKPQNLSLVRHNVALLAVVILAWLCLSTGVACDHADAAGGWHDSTLALHAQSRSMQHVKIIELLKPFEFLLDFHSSSFKMIKGMTAP